MSIVTNIFLIIKEGFNPKKMLGIILEFLAICGSQTLYFLLNKLLLGTNKQFIKYTIDICLNATLLYFYTLIIATLYCNIKTSKHIPKYDKDFVIILGSKIRKDGSLTPLLQGSDEVISEAETIKNYLLSKGISKNQIIVENKSTNTFENFNFSKKKINDINNSGKIFLQPLIIMYFEVVLLLMRMVLIVKELVVKLSGIFILMH